MDTTPAAAPIVPGVTDTRGTTLADLARDSATVADSLRHVLPDDGTGRVAVAAFGSSI